MNLTSKERAYLRSKAQTIDPIFQLGKNGVTPEGTEAIGQALEARELVKINVLQNCMENPKEMAETIAGRTRSIVVQVIGKKIILFKQSKKNPKYIGKPEATEQDKKPVAKRK